MVIDLFTGADVPLAIVDLNQRITQANQGFSSVHTATTDPTTSDDSYEIGTTWINTSGELIWVCIDNSTGAAVWIRTAGRIGVEMRLTAAQTLAHNTWETLIWDSALNDTHSWFDSSNPGYITVPYDGLMVITGEGGWGSVSNFSSSLLRYRKNSTVFKSENKPGNSFGTYPLSGFTTVSAGDLIRMDARHIQGGTPSTADINQAKMDVYLEVAIT